MGIKTGMIIWDAINNFWYKEPEILRQDIPIE